MKNAKQIVAQAEAKHPDATHPDAESGIRWAVEALKDRSKDNVENVRTTLMHLVVRYLMKQNPRAALVELDEARDRLVLASSALHEANAYRGLSGANEKDPDVTKALQEVYTELGVAIISANAAASWLNGEAKAEIARGGVS